MFSARFHWDLRPNRITEAIEAKRRAGAPILDLTESNPTRAGLSYPTEIVDALADPRMLVYEPAPAGMSEARQAVSAYYALRAQQVDAERILLTASTSEAYAYLFKLLSNPNDRVLVPRPSYPLFEFLAAMESIEVRPYALAYHGAWSIDLDSLAVFALADETVLRGDRHHVIDRGDAGVAGAHDPGRPPGDPAVGVEAEPEPAAERAVGVDEVAVVRLVPQVLAVGGVPCLVARQDDVCRRHRPGPGCMAEAPGGPGTSTMGSSRSSNSVRSAFDITACWKYSVVM